MKIVEAFTVTNLDEFALSDADEQRLKDFLLESWEVFDTIRASVPVEGDTLQIVDGILNLAVVSFMAGCVYQANDGKVMVPMTPHAMAAFLAYLTEPVTE
jgi:hypothetical protein